MMTQKFAKLEKDNPRKLYAENGRARSLGNNVVEWSKVRVAVLTKSVHARKIWVEKQLTKAADGSTGVGVDGNKAPTKTAKTSQRPPPVADADKATQPKAVNTRKVEKPDNAAQAMATRDSKGIYTLSDSSGVEANAPAERTTPQTPATPSAE